MWEPGTDESVARTSQKGGIPAEASAVTGFADTIDVPGIDTALIEVHASGIAATLDVERAAMPKQAHFSSLMPYIVRRLLLTQVRPQLRGDSGVAQAFGRRDRSDQCAAPSWCAG